MTDEWYQWHWWEANKRLKKLKRELLSAERILGQIEAEMEYRGVRKPKRKVRLKTTDYQSEGPY